MTALTGYVYSSGAGQWEAADQGVQNDVQLRATGEPHNASILQIPRVSLVSNTITFAA